MNRTFVNFCLDLCAYLLFLFLISTGLLLAFLLIPGSRGGHGLMMLGLTRHEWGDVHFYVAMGFLSVIVLHIAMHWAWVKTTFFVYITKKNMLMLSLVGLMSLLIIVLPFLLPIEKRAGEGDRHEHGQSQTPSEFE